MRCTWKNPRTDLRLTILFLGGLLLLPLSAASQVCNPEELTCITGPRFLVKAFNGTVVKNGGKCLDYASEVAGAPVFLNDCSAAHGIGVHELEQRDEAGNRIRNQVLLVAGSKVIGLRRPGATISPGGPPIGGEPSEFSLELQNLAGSNPPPHGGLEPLPSDQIFALDGDSILYAADREFVAKVQNGRGRNGTPIVLGSRRLADEEFWNFQPANGEPAFPTTAFVPAADINALIGYLGPAADPRPDFGTVFVVAEAPIILLREGQASEASAMAFDSFPTLTIPSGVTVRSDRRGTRLGAELFMPANYEGAIFSIGGSDTRVTGLRIRGPNTSRNTDIALKDWHTDGIVAREEHPRTTIDHNEISDWTWVAVRAQGKEETEWCSQVACVDDFGGAACVPKDPVGRGRANNIWVARNFLHHNLVQDRGYGVDNNSGGFALIEGNTFSWNRHAIAGTNSTPGTGYRAWSNLVLSEVPEQRVGPVPLFCTHDFDMHGTGNNGFGGIAGGYIQIAGNTFLGTTDTCISHNNFSLRSVSCDQVEIHNNIFLQSESDAVVFEVRLEDDVVPWATVSTSPRQFYPSDFVPTSQLGVGDFDGDGRQDLFLATGAAFYFSPGGEAEWRLLAGGRTDRIETLLFGDFDGDGRTDVVGKNGGILNVSWGGSAEWERLNSTGASITDLAAGNFDGVEGDDLFWANGANWFVSSAGSGHWTRTQTSGFRVRDLRFGDFNRNGTTDVFGVVSGSWSISDGATVGWQPLRSKLTDTARGLIVADFNGNGYPDIAVWNSGDTFALNVSYDARGEFTPVGVPHVALAGVGHFRGDVNADILIWIGNELKIIPVLEPPRVRSYSRGDMK